MVNKMHLGCSRTQKGYNCYDPILGKFYISADATFFESTPFFSASGSTLGSELFSPTPILNPVVFLPKLLQVKRGEHDSKIIGKIILLQPFLGLKLFVAKEK